MLFTTYSYFAFLALTALGHWALPSGPARSVWLVLCSLVFYSVTQGGFVLLLGAYVVFNWWAGRRLARQSGPRGLLGLALAANLAPLVYYKYVPALAASVPLLRDGWLGAALGSWIPGQAPLGISFFA